MTQLEIKITGANGQLEEKQLLTGGMVGVPIRFSFDESWDGLRKCAVFRAGGTAVACPELEEVTTIPWEVMKAGCTLYAGVYGHNAAGTLVIPTVWVELGTIAPGADPEADEAMDPQLPVWRENQEIAQQALAVAESVRRDADAGAFQGPQGEMGRTPVRGVDYWTEADQAWLKGYVESAILGGVW